MPELHARAVAYLALVAAAELVLLLGVVWALRARWRGHARDASDLATEAMEELVGLLDAILASAPVGFAFFDRQLRCLRINPAAAALNGMSLEAHIGKPLSAILSADALAAALPKFTEVLRTGHPVMNVDATAHAQSGELREALVNYFPVYSREQVVGVGVVLVDLTERKQLEGQLRQAQKMEAIGRLAGGVAHDFNNLLTVIRSYADILDLELPERDERRTSVAEIRSASERAAGLARQLLAFGRKQTLTSQVLDVNEIVASMEPMLRRLVAVNIAMRLTLRPGLSGVRADPGQLEQVVMNLVINAADAMPSGGRLGIETHEVTLDAEYARQHAGMIPGRYVALVVSDTGTGMDEATRARIFEPFFTTKPAGVGTGLGLATVYGIVRQSHGYIWVYSVMGHGTTFKVHFPAVAADGSLVWQAGERTTAAERGSETILLVEDEPAVRESTRRILARHGYTVLVASGGADALRIGAEHAGSIDLVISDLMLPDLGGRELAAELRARRPRARLLFMSGYTDDDVRRRGLLDAADEFIQKPFSFDELTQRVRELLDRSGERA